MAAAWLALVGLAGCTSGDSNPGNGYRGWNVLLVTADTTRADRIGCYRHAAARTPVLDGLAARGRVFDNAVAQTPLTLPSHASILTGLFPTNHGARNNGTFLLGEGHDTLAHHLGQNGYQTAAVIAAFVLDRKFGLARGFDAYEDAIGGTARSEFGFAERKGVEVTRLALEQAEGFASDKPWFLWTHYFDPHAPYEPAPDLASGFPPTAVGRYDAEIATMDREIGRLLDGLERMGRLKRTIIVVIGDHGEGIAGPHAEKSHGIFLYDDTIRVPFILSCTGGWPTPGRSEKLARQVDVTPTLLDLLEIPLPDGLDGVSLRPQLSDGGDDTPSPDAASTAPETFSYAETFFPLESFGWAPLFHVRTRGWKYIEAPEPELYDLTADPAESTNVIDAHPDRRAELEQHLAEVRAGARYAGASGGTRTLDDAEARRLRMLGYTTSDAEPTELGWDELRDPKKWIDLHEDLEACRIAHLDGDEAGAMARLDRVFARDPDNFEALGLKATVLLAQGDTDGAIDTLARLTELLPTSPQHFVRYGGVLFQQAAAHARAGDRTAELDAQRRAREAFETAVELGSNDVAPYVNLGVLLLRDEAYDRAAELFERALTIEPESYAACYNLGHAQLKKLELEDAAASLDRALPLAEGDPSRLRRLWEDRAEVHTRLSEWEPALALYAKLLENYPGDPRADHFRKVVTAIREQRSKNEG